MEMTRSQCGRRRGQALVLAALSMLLLALMIALSFNLSHALHEKMRLQQHSDALAYSMGVVEARAFNYFASSNRAIAASLVAMNTLHADMAAASVTVAMMKAAQDNFYVIAGEETLICIAERNPTHCVHAAQAIEKAGKFGQAARKYARKVKGVEGSFRLSVQSLDAMIDVIHASQLDVLKDAVEVVRAGTADSLSKLKQSNAPEATDVASAVGALNMNALNCAIDGSPLPCIGGSGPGNTSKEVHGELMTSIANASRPDWPAHRGSFASIPLYLDPRFLNDLMHKIQGKGVSTPIGHKGTAKTVESKSQGQLHAGQSASDTGKVSGADEHGELLSQYRDGVSVWAYKAEIYSDKNGGKHTPTDGHSGQHKFQGVNSSGAPCLGSGNCFMKFRADSSKDHDFGQPAVYSVLKMKLRAGDVKKAPWELNDGAKVSITGPDGEEGTLHLAAEEGSSLSKALVYFHRIGAWKDPPNFFEPYWRVKLHPFTQTEVVKVLTLSGQSDAAILANAPGLSF